jgi:hypothetical protein
MKQVLKLNIFILFFLSISVLAFGQSGRIVGQVIDSENQETLSGATISISGTKIKTIADLDGNFTLNLAPGVYKIEISMISYETKTEILEIKNEPSKELKIKLSQVGALNSKEAESIIAKQLVTQNVGSKEA